jgi:hypothetical protein
MFDRFATGIADPRRQSWRLFLVFGISLILWSCATIPRVKVTAEVVDPRQARSRSVMVVTDSFMSDTAEAEMVAELIRGELASAGFKINDSDEKAELIVIPTLERSAPTGSTAAPSRMRRPIDSSHEVGGTSLMRSQSAMQSLGFEFGTLPVQEEPRIGLMVTAITKDVWLNAPLASESEIPRVWRVVAVAPLSKEDMTSKLVEAAGAKLSEVATAPSTPVPPSPTPSPTPKKET